MHISEDILRPKSYPQNWRAYNRAQTTEKEHLMFLLQALCENLEEPPQTQGRPRLPIKDAIFTACFKVYTGFSGRRFMTDLREAKENGFISRAAHFNTTLSVFNNPEVTPILHQMIEMTSLPLAEVETAFAADSSGFTASRVTRWHDHKYGKWKQHQWTKVHLMCGVRTNIVTAVHIADKYAGDAQMLPGLLQQTAKNFTLEEVSADKAYASFKNYDAIAACGAVPYIPFKENHIKVNPLIKSPLWGQKKLPNNDLWNKMHSVFLFNKKEFMTHYHKRSNVEATFSMIKAKFGGFVRSKNETAMMNECLCKIICHNICVLIHEMHDLGIEINFVSQKVSVI